MISGSAISGVWRVTVILRARMKSPSLPVMPMALPPFLFSRLTICLFTKAAEHHLNDVHRGAIRHAHAVDETGS